MTRQQITELTEQISMYESQVLLLIANAPSARRAAAVAARAAAIAAGELENDPDHLDDEQEGEDDEEEDEATEDQFVELEEDLANVIADVHDLGIRISHRLNRVATDCIPSPYRSFLSFKLHWIRQDCQSELTVCTSFLPHISYRMMSNLLREYR